MTFDSVVDAQRALSNQVAECAYGAAGVLAGSPLHGAHLQAVIGDLIETVEGVLVAMQGFDKLVPGSQERGLVQGKTLVASLKQAQLQLVVTEELEGSFADFFLGFGIHPPFGDLVKAVRAELAT